MGFFSSSESTSDAPDLTKKSARKTCWDARDKYFGCLDKNDILDPRKDANASKVCKTEETDFDSKCIKSWVRYFIFA